MVASLSGKKMEPTPDGDAPADSAAHIAYDQLKALVVNFDFMPGERLNELELCKRIGVSRTPLREALNRLSAEGFLRAVAGKGFYCRDLDPVEILNLYELRKVIEVAAISIAAMKASHEEVQKLQTIQDEIDSVAGSSMTRLLELDEEFHTSIVRISGNLEFLRVLRNVNDRLRFVRGFDAHYANHDIKAREHTDLIRFLVEHDAENCVRVLERHIELRQDQVLATIKEGLTKIYMSSMEANRR